MMKKSMRKIGIIAVAAVMALGLFAGCDGLDVPTVINISGATTYNPVGGKTYYGVLYLLSSPSAEEPTYLSVPQPIAGGRAEFAILSNNGTPAAVNGNYVVKLVIYDNMTQSGDSEWDKSTAIRAISPGVQDDINWSSFTVNNK